MSSYSSQQNSILCPMCQFETPSMELCLSHLRLVHGNDPRFCAPCGIGGCSYTGKSFPALYSHIYRTHPESGVIKPRGHRGKSRTLTNVDVGESSVSLREAPQVQDLRSPDFQGQYKTSISLYSISSCLSPYRRRSRS